MNNYAFKELYTTNSTGTCAVSMFAYSVYLRSGGDPIKGRYQITVDSFPEIDMHTGQDIPDTILYIAKLEKWTDKGFVLVSIYRFDDTNTFQGIVELLSSHFKSFTLGEIDEDSVFIPPKKPVKIKNKKTTTKADIQKLADKYIKKANKKKDTNKCFDFL
tara:strand:- start:1821 stop:2300 length:480 start_codon:yes stop_codon:yes gene_type:complete